MKFIKNLFISIFVFIFILYFAAIGYLYINQDRILFHNKNSTEMPSFNGLNVENIRIKTIDGENLQAWYLKPKNNKPIILYFFGSGSSLESQKWRIIRLNKKGYGILAFAYRGFSGSSGKPSENGLRIDGLSAYDWLIKNNYKPDEIIIHGHSLGSGVATYVASQRPAKFLALEAPFISALKLAQEKYPFFPIKLLMRNKFENDINIKKVNIPVLIAHGDKDTIIPYRHGKTLCETANFPKKFIGFKGSDHNTLVIDGFYNSLDEYSSELSFKDLR